MHIEKFYIKIDNIKKYLPEEYKDCDVMVINSSADYKGIEVECVFDKNIDFNVHDQNIHVINL